MDIDSSDSKLLEEYKEVYLQFVDQEINVRRRKQGLENIEIEFITLANLMKSNGVDMKPDFRSHAEIINHIFKTYLKFNGWIYGRYLVSAISIK